MKCIERLTKYRDEDFDAIILKIRDGTIKCGKYSHLVKINKGKEMKGKEFFNNGSKDNKSK